MENYDKFVSRIASSSGISAEELDKKVEAKIAKLAGLVSKEGAVQIVAAELGVNLDKERLKISEIVHGMKKVNVLGKVVDIGPVREFNKNNRQGKVVNLLFADDTSNTRVVLWDTNHIELVEKGKIKKGDVLEISNGSVRNGEIHLTSFSDIKKSDEVLNEVIEKKVYSLKKASDARVGESFKMRAFIVQVFEPRYFEVCPECRKRVVEGKCAEHGEVKGERRALINLVLDDGSESLRCVLFGDSIKKLGLSDEEIFSAEKFSSRKEDIIGSEMLFSGNLRTNNLYNTQEFFVEDAEQIDIDLLVKEIEARA